MSRVVTVHDSQVTSWNGSSLWFGSNSYVSQSAVDAMVRAGVLALTGQPAEVDAWSSLLPSASASTKVGIKINSNNGELGPRNNDIDWTPQVVNAVIKGLKARGFSESNISVMDPSRGRSAGYSGLVTASFPNVKMYGSGWQDPPFLSATYTSADSSLTVAHPCGGPASKLPDQLLDLEYQIQIPIMKVHGFGVTLTYKNLLGYKGENTILALHDYMMLSSRNPLVDLYANMNIKNKTKLIVGDGIYGHSVRNYGGLPPPRWSVLGNDWPKRLFFATDPVAIDCVMYDFLNWENPRSADDENYIICAANANHGTRDHWNNPRDKNYTMIDFIQREIH